MALLPLHLREIFEQGQLFHRGCVVREEEVVDIVVVADNPCNHVPNPNRKSKRRSRRRSSHNNTHNKNNNGNRPQTQRSMSEELLPLSQRPSEMRILPVRGEFAAGRWESSSCSSGLSLSPPSLPPQIRSSSDSTVTTTKMDKAPTFRRRPMASLETTTKSSTCEASTKDGAPHLPLRGASSNRTQRTFSLVEAVTPQKRAEMTSSRTPLVMPRRRPEGPSSPPPSAPPKQQQDLKSIISIALDNLESVLLTDQEAQDEERSSEADDEQEHEQPEQDSVPQAIESSQQATVQAI